MARKLEELQKQYNSVSHGMSLRGGGPGSRHGHRGKGKPKNVGKTIKRLLSYVGKYKLRLVFVFLSMFLTTISSLCAGYLIAPIINRITLAVNPDAVLDPSPLEVIADGVVETFVSTPFISSLMGDTVAAVTVYVFALIPKEGFLVSPCYSLELCIQIGISFLFSFPFCFPSFTTICKASSDDHFGFCISLSWG